jgi:tetratricopeptide (TPR) repeat protein
LAERLDARLVARRAEAREMLATPGDVAKMAAIKVIADDLLTARPDDREAIEIKRQADAAIARLHSPNAAAVVVETPWVDVQSRFRTGDASGALTLAQACAPKAAQCRTLESELKEFDSKFKSLEQLPELELFSLFELDRKIAGGQSSDLSKPIRTRVAAAFYLKASQSKTTGNWSKAIENARRVLQADSAHAGALNLLSEARNQAKEVYLRGYQLKDSTPDEAARLFKEVIAMTPKDDEYHQKADARLAEIQKQ